MASLTSVSIEAGRCFVTKDIPDYLRGDDPKPPFYVEIQCGGVWDLWWEADTLAIAAQEVQILKDHDFGYRVTDDNGEAVEV